MREATPEERGLGHRNAAETIDIEQETLLSMREVPDRLPRKPSGKRIHISAVYRWVSGGVGGVRLESIKIGGTTYTSAEALQRFAERRQGRDAEGPPLTPKRRQAEIDAAAAQAESILFRN